MPHINSSQESILLTSSAQENASSVQTNDLEHSSTESSGLASIKEQQIPPNQESTPTPQKAASNGLTHKSVVVGMVAIAGTACVVGAVVIALEVQQTRQLNPPQLNLNQPPLPSMAPLPPIVIPTVPEPDPLADSTEKMQLDHAQRLAADDQFQAAIAEANQIPSNSLFYQQAQLLISQWSERILQAKAEQRAIQQRSQAEHERNQQHLQLAQQALVKNDWQAALDEAGQISNDPLLQQARDSIIQQVKPYEYEQQARAFLAQGELDNAFYEANKLPSITPWQNKRDNLLEQVKQARADQATGKIWNERCREWTKANISRCPNQKELEGVKDILMPGDWLSRLLPSGRKSKR